MIKSVRCRRSEADDEAPEAQSDRGALERHHDVCGRAPQQRPREDRAVVEAVGKKVARDRADGQCGEQRRDEAALAGAAQRAGQDRAAAFDWKSAMNQFAILFGERFTQTRG